MLMDASSTRPACFRSGLLTEVMMLGLFDRPACQSALLRQFPLQNSAIRILVWEPSRGEKNRIAVCNRAADFPQHFLSSAA